MSCEYITWRIPQLHSCHGEKWQWIAQGSLPLHSVPFRGTEICEELLSYSMAAEFIWKLFLFQVAQSSLSSSLHPFRNSSAAVSQIFPSQSCVSSSLLRCNYTRTHSFCSWEHFLQVCPIQMASATPLDVPASLVSCSCFGLSLSRPSTNYSSDFSCYPH